MRETVKKHQIKAITQLYLRDKHCWPRGAFRQYPIKDRRGSTKSAPLKAKSALNEFLRWNKDVYLSVFSDDQKRSKMYDLVFLDIDGSSLATAYDTLRYVLRRLEDRGINEYDVLFSGSKGFHVYIPFEPVLLNNYGLAVRKWLRETLNVLTVVDTAVLEPNRVSRIPYSLNRKGRYCVPLRKSDVGFGINYIERLSEDGNDLAINLELKPNIGIAAEIRAHDNKAVHLKKAIKVANSKSIMFKTTADYPPCMNKLVIAAKDTDLGHMERLEMAKFLLHVYGGDRAGVAQHYSTMSDYDPAVTNYQIDYAADGRMKIAGCDKMQGYGVCVFAEDKMADCPFYPSIQKVCDMEIGS